MVLVVVTVLSWVMILRRRVRAQTAVILRQLQSEAALKEAAQAWLYGSFTKVVLQVHSEQELYDYWVKARMAGLTAHLITDSGRTEFGGVPTKTCVAIGPDWAHEIDTVTGDLRLY